MTKTFLDLLDSLFKRKSWRCYFFLYWLPILGVSGIIFCIYFRQHSPEYQDLLKIFAECLKRLIFAVIVVWLLYASNQSNNEDEEEIETQYSSIDDFEKGKEFTRYDLVPKWTKSSDAAYKNTRRTILKALKDWIIEDTGKKKEGTIQIIYKKL